ncbi:MAG: hypothetical protein ACSW8D_14440 [Prevotella sp.]
MIAEKTVKMTVIRDGEEKEVDVRMRYCAAAEQGFETLSGKRMDVFSPTPTAWDADGNPTKFDPPMATTQDYLTLSVAAIVAAYARTNCEPPVTSEDIIYDALPATITELITTVVTLRIQWYKVPDVVQPEMKPDNRKRRKNA